MSAQPAFLIRERRSSSGGFQDFLSARNRAMCVSAWDGGRQSMIRSLSEREKLAGEIAGLQSLDVEQPKARWRTLYRSEAPSRFRRELLMRGVAYRMQERALGGLSSATRR